MKSGGSANRTGTTYQGTFNHEDGTGRMVRWIYNNAQTYKLEFIDQQINIWKDGSPVLNASTAITAISTTNPCVVTSVGHGIGVNTKVNLSGIVGMTELNGRSYIATVTSVDTFTIAYAGDGTAYGTAVDSRAFTAYSSGGIVENHYGIESPYLEADIPSLEFAQSADTMLIVNGYAPRTLTRSADNDWTLAIMSNSPSTDYPTGLSVSVGVAGTLTTRYTVTAVNEANGIESLAGTAHEKTISAITKSDPAVVTTSAAHGYETGNEAVFGTVSGMSDLSNRRFKIQLGDANGANTTTMFRLVGEDSTFYDNFTSGTVSISHYNLLLSDTPTEAAPNVITIGTTALAGIRYDIYKETGGIFGFIGSTYALTFNDTGLTADTLQSTPIYREPFQGEENWPKACAFYQERSAFGGSERLANYVFTSVQGDYFNFTIHSPHEDEDAVTFNTAGSNDAIQHLTSLNKLIISTTGAEWVVNGGGEGGTLTPTQTNVQAITFNGSGTLPPIQIDSNLLYIDRGHRVMDFHYSFKDNGYLGEDRSTYARHLFEGHSIVDWAYQRLPGSVVWMVRDDGVVLSMTYIPEQELYSFARHDFHGGTVENVVVIPEGEAETAEDAVYFVVARTLDDDSTTRYVERLANSIYSDVEDAIYLDSALSYDGTISGSVTLTGSGWTNATTLTCTFGTAQTNATAGNVVQIFGVDDDGEDFELRCRIISAASTTVVTVIPHTTVPVVMRAVAQTDCRMSVDNFVGLWHLEGKTISIAGDSRVIASALNPEIYQTSYTVEDGEITLEGGVTLGLAHFGLPITADMAPLDVDPAEDGRVMSSMKLPKAVAVRVSESASFWIGSRPPDDDDEDPIQNLEEPKIRENELYGEPTALKTGVVKVRVASRWNRQGRFFLRVMEPGPVRVVAVSTSGFLYE